MRADGSLATLASTGPPLGLLPLGQPYGESRETIAPGDTLVLFSDGITDAQNSASEEFGDVRLGQVLAASAGGSPDAIIDRVFAAIDAFVGAAPQFDDMTILVCRRD